VIGDAGRASSQRLVPRLVDAIRYPLRVLTRSGMSRRRIYLAMSR
jgi:hypothetical protein